MIWFICLLMGIYVLALLQSIFLWAKKDRLTDLTPKSMKVSLIVPFRNEQENLPSLVNCLAVQSHQNLEVLFINDHSTDQSVELLKTALAKFPFPYQLLHLVEEEGKKAAIALGVTAASGEIILTTDADCEMGPEWVEEMLKPFADEQIQMVSGPVALTGKGLFQRWQMMEFATLIALGAVGVRRGKPGMANGANLAYRKSAFEKVGGFKHIDQTPSGDDELLLMKMHQAFPKGIRFRKSRKAIVSTAALPRWSVFKNQRLRWASKWKVGDRPAVKFTALFVFVLNLMWLFLPLFAFLDWVEPEVPVRIYAIRFVIEAIWVMALATFFDHAISIRAFYLHQFLYPVYVVYFGLMANFGNYQWKDRSYSVKPQ